MSSPAAPKAISPTAEPKNHEHKQKQTHHRPEVSVGKETESRGGGASLSFTATLPVGFSGRPPRVAGVLSISLACALSNAHHHYGALSLVKRSGALNASCQLLRITCEESPTGRRARLLGVQLQSLLRVLPHLVVELLVLGQLSSVGRNHLLDLVAPLNHVLTEAALQ